MPIWVTRRSPIAPISAVTGSGRAPVERGDDVQDDDAVHVDEQALAAIITMIATTNFCNRLNVTVRQPSAPPDPDPAGVVEAR